MSSQTSLAVLIATRDSKRVNRTCTFPSCSCLNSDREQGGETKRGKEVVSWTQGECWGFFTLVYNADLIKYLQLLLENTFSPFFTFCLVYLLLGESAESLLLRRKYVKLPFVKETLFNFSLSAVFNVKFIDIRQSASRFKQHTRRNECFPAHTSMNVFWTTFRRFIWCCLLHSSSQLKWKETVISNYHMLI